MLEQEQVMSCPVCATPVASSGGIYCPACVVNTLYYTRQAIAYKKVALRDVFDQAKAVLSAKKEVFEKEHQLAQVIRESAAVQEKMLETTKRISDERVQVARRSFSLRDRALALDKARQALDHAAGKYEQRSAPVRAGLEWCKTQAEFSVHYRMWTRALEHFVILPIEADVPVERESGRLLRGTRELHGVSTIASVPLPNSGNLAGMPDEVLEAALYLVCRLTSSLSSVLDVTLPHPLSFPPSRTYATVADDQQRGHAFDLSPSCHGSGGGGAKQPPPLHRRSHSLGPGTSVGGTGGGSGMLQTPDNTGDFHLGLEYLQNDVHQLAIKAGVDSSELWAKEALLLNLWALQQHALRVVRRLGPVVDLPLPALRRPQAVTQEGPPTGTHDGGVRGSVSGGGGGGLVPTITFEDDRDDEWTHVHTTY